MTLMKIMYIFMIAMSLIACAEGIFSKTDVIVLTVITLTLMLVFDIIFYRAEQRRAKEEDID